MVVIVIGVTGSGKTTIGRMLSRQLGWEFFDADDFHPSANVEKMRAGIPLNDDDRRPWLESLRQLIQGLLDRGENGVLACSALKEAYRNVLLVTEQVKLVYLKGDFHLIESRIKHRQHPFMNPNLLRSQFDALEEPRRGIVVDITPSPRVIVQEIRSQLGV